MQMILDLQKFEVADADAMFGNSCTSSLYTCCNGGLEWNDMA
jgi:hypothetical protein